MCGIAGFVSTENSLEASFQYAVQRMTNCMRVRGPDGEGVWVSKGVALGHRRLAILDLDVRSNQPMISIDGNYSIVFNGEIYNFRELRAEMEAEGVVFRTTSDTEVLLALFARDGERMLPRLRGMFAFAIWNARSRELFLARDPYGIKPLYYGQLEGGLIFASQVKALMASGMVSTAIEPAGVAGFYLWGSVPEPWTLYRKVFALAAGNWMRVRAGVPQKPVCWKDIRSSWQEDGRKESARELQDRVRDATTDSVRAHLVSDVPVSVFLSGGIDSSVVAGLASGLGAKVEGITVGFDEFSSLHQDEVPVAASIAAHYGLRHHVRRISRAEFESDTPYILDAMDQPSIDGVNTWFASKAAAERGYKVVLSGIGGDELFRGYTYTREIPRNVKLGKVVAAIPGMRALLKALCANLAHRRSQPKLRGVPQFLGSLEGLYFLKRGLFLPDELPALMGEEMAWQGVTRLGGSPPGVDKTDATDGAAGVCLLDSTLYLRNQLLRDSDWASMGHSLELRTPLVDAALLDSLKPHLVGFADGFGKKMLACSPKKPLPQGVINRPKTGFTVPMAKWLSEATDQQGWADVPFLTSPGTPWARRWARTVMNSTIRLS
jgi:asparagine synthase (glutamine-hydrolysing)